MRLNYYAYLAQALFQKKCRKKCAIFVPPNAICVFATDGHGDNPSFGNDTGGPYTPQQKFCHWVDQSGKPLEWW